MTTDFETVELRLDEQNELLFKVLVQGTANAPAHVRLVCSSDNVSYMFEGEAVEDGETRFIIPEMKKLLEENKIYEAKVEVVVDNRYFVPVTFGLKFKQSMKVVSEGIRVKKSDPVPTVRVSASLPKPTIEKRQVVPDVSKVSLREKALAKKNVTGLNDSEMSQVVESVLNRLQRK